MSILKKLSTQYHKKKEQFFNPKIQNSRNFIKKTFLIPSVLLLTAALFTGCSSDKGLTDQIVIHGVVKMPEVAGTVSLQTYTENPAQSETQKTVQQDNHKSKQTTPDNLKLTTNNEEVFTAPITTAYFNPEEYIIKFNKNISSSYLKKLLQNRGSILNNISRNIYKVKLDDNNNELLNSLKNNPLVTYIEPEYLVHIQAIPDDPAFFQRQWNLQMLNLNETWDNTKGSRDVTVAVIDTGILPDHPDLKANIVAGYDFIDNDNDPTDTDPDFSHGTHVAGIIGAVTNNGQGIAGINWNIKIMPVRVIGPGGSGGYSTLVKGIYWAVDNGANIINLSLAGPVNSKSLQDAVDYAIAHNVVVVAAAGNNGSNSILYPAHYPEVISVGAIGPDKHRAYYSNYGPELDLVAPGGDNSVNDYQYNTILSTAGYMNGNTPVHQYTWAQGTSMAAPHVTGLIALLYSVGYDRADSIERLLKNTADDLGPAGKDNEYGAGLININRALKYIDRSNNTVRTSDKIKIIATNYQSKKQLTAFTDKTSGKFSLALNEGRWKIEASVDNSAGFYTGSLDINVPGDDNIEIQLK